MTVTAHFAATYEEARGKFREAAKGAGARLFEVANPRRGPHGEDLTTDIAWLGPRDAERVLMTLSGTHGVEGFCGSGVQVAWFETGLAQNELPPGMALMQVHGINCHGFAWLRRTTEENVDLNRNFIDFDQPFPENAGYDELAEAICPPEWNDAVIAQTAAILLAYADKHGMRALQSAVSSGQYRHPHGIFYGGNSPTWAHQTLEKILTEHLGGAKKVAVIDYHTGLGPRGYGERICVHPPGSRDLERARQWYEDDVTSPALGNSSSVEIKGYNFLGMRAALPDAELTHIALEYGTLPTEEVKLALRADNWLHVHGAPLEAFRNGQAVGIKRQIRDAFYQDADDWKEMVWERGAATQRLALRGLSEG